MVRYSTYDQWKLATPWDDEPEEEHCACDGTGWVEDEYDRIIACPECRTEHLTADDVEEIEYQMQMGEERTKCRGCRPRPCITSEINDRVPF